MFWSLKLGIISYHYLNGLGVLDPSYKVIGSLMDEI